MKILGAVRGFLAFPAAVWRRAFFDFLMVGGIVGLFGVTTAIVWREPWRFGMTLGAGIFGGSISIITYLVSRQGKLKSRLIQAAFVLTGIFAFLGSLFVFAPYGTYGVFDTTGTIRLVQGGMTKFFPPFVGYRFVKIPKTFVHSFPAGLSLGGERTVEWEIDAFLELTADQDTLFSQIVRLGGGREYLAEVREIVTDGAGRALKQKFDAENPEQKYLSQFSITLPGEYGQALAKLGYKVRDIFATEPRVVRSD